ncbi:hypothetical protein ABB07_14585 [Streptomyces incarnatus]|uniref:Extensin n=1 Tax=Streptomyces incarnatus TaxID=665007 RepID=A0ABM5TJR7_9ACTN|nr:hypothetical protein [Streptomyces incarnatus]AKJ11206.1 hypothetical protein ABB07_14585 [Streptomyces incarnatus]
MADEQYKWLNRETAERLLRGESLEAVDASARDQAERLSRALGALTSQTAPAADELPGEQAALAAFRKAREAAGTEGSTADRAGDTARSSAPGADAGLVRIGTPARTGIPARRRPRWGRPVRLALAAAVAVGTVGGVAMAAGTGVLPTPFGPEHPASSSSSVSADPSSGSALASVPQGTPGATVSPGAPSGSAGTHPGASGAAVGPGDHTGKSTPPGSGDPSGTPGGRWKDAASACRDIRDGRELDAGRRRALENLAGGSARVSRYCKAVLATVDSVDGATGGGKGDDKGDKGKGKGSGQGDDEGHPGHGGDGHPGWWGGNGGKGDGGGKGNGGKGNGGGKGRHGDDVASAPSALSPARHTWTTGTVLGPVPSPTYTAL